MDRSLIQLRRITKVYEEGGRQRVVLRDLNADIKQDELVVLLGRSGSGKSTLLNLISGIDLPTAGEVIVNSVSLTQLSEHERTLFRRRHIGFVFQFFNLIPTLTVEENLLLPLELNDDLGDAARESVYELLGQVGLGDRAASYPDRLSGGEQQRIAIARALVHEPAVVLADEPTGNLDRETGHEVLQLLAHMRRTAGATLLIVTHSTEALSLADRAYRIDDGQLVPATGPETNRP